jgi:hypothetical protein
MSKSMRSRIADAFKDSEPRSYLNDFTTEIRTNWREVEKDLKRSAFLMFVFATVFELLTRGGVAELSLSFVKVTDLGIIQRLLPVAVAYFAYSTVSLLLETAVYLVVHDACMKTAYPSLSAEDLNRLIWPSNSVLLGEARFMYFLEERSIVSRSLDITTAVKLLALVLAPLAFEIYAFWRLFAQFGFWNILVWFSAALSLLAFVSIFVLGNTWYKLAD